jgi:predicted DNA binding CopG/RHH family protein
MSKKVSFSSKPTNRVESSDADKWVEQRKVAVAKMEKMKRFTIDIPQSLHRKMKTSCSARGIKMADEIRELLENNYKE